MLKTRVFFFSILSILVLLVSNIHPVSASGISVIKNSTPTVVIEVINCILEEGWCSQNPYVVITGDDPAYTILAIEGSTNAKNFHYDGKACSISLKEGLNDLFYWSVSSSGKFSEKKNLKINLSTNMTGAFPIYTLSNPIRVDSLPARLLHADPISSSLPILTSSNEKKSFLLSEVVQSENRFDLDQLALLSKGSLSLYPINLDEKSNTLGKGLIQPTAGSSTPLNKIVVEDITRISAYIFSDHLRRNPNSQKNIINSQSRREEYNLVLDILPPDLSILEQKSISGILTFEGHTYDGVSGIQSLMVNLGQDWIPVHQEQTRWTYQWNTEKEGISGGEFSIQVLAIDSAGNQSIQIQRFTVINRIWPVLTLCGLLLSLGFTAFVDPRRKAWKELAQVTARAIEVNAMKLGKENR